MLKILLLGKNGQVGWELQRALSPLGELRACDRSEANLDDPESLRQLIREYAPDIIVNAAAYTSGEHAIAGGACG
jgi:dTDP-4-dehydrorhamnose reductase